MKWHIGWIGLGVLLACTEARTNLVSDPAVRDAADAMPTAPHEAGTGDAQTVADAAAHQPSALCGKRACACDDGIDNDMDGLIDGLDPECTGSFDDDEASFGIGKSNKQTKCRDCFWDDNVGPGDDGCRYPEECLNGATPVGAGNCSSCTVSQACDDRCGSRTPNGCDCFGCCEVAAASGVHVFIELTENCSLARLDDTQACPRCVQNTVCANPCGRCELCLGKRLSDLPADCTPTRPGGPAYACDEGQVTCASSAECAGASYCELGCCLDELF
jgi:hypothetical protein